MQGLLVSWLLALSYASSVRDDSNYMKAEEEDVREQELATDEEYVADQELATEELSTDDLNMVDQELATDEEKNMAEQDNRTCDREKIKTEYSILRTKKGDYFENAKCDEASKKSFTGPKCLKYYQLIVNEKTGKEEITLCEGRKTSSGNSATGCAISKTKCCEGAACAPFIAGEAPPAEIQEAIVKPNKAELTALKAAHHDDKVAKPCERFSNIIVWGVCYVGHHVAEWLEGHGRAQITNK